ncbi:MAG TPA: DMT family transporter [Candidatus Sulfomarinibacteraceae bacterium]|nr:DMT family transporter [Candidatus Sulfomarinibacteraceae bacterium]
MQQRTSSTHYRAVFQALFVTFLWSTSWVLIKIGLEDIPALTFAGLRYSLAFLLLLPLAAKRQELGLLRELTRRDWLNLAVLGLVYYSVTQGAQFVALDLLPAVTISLMLNFTSVIVAVMGIVLLAEWPTGRQWLGTFIFLLGVVLYFSRDLSTGMLASNPGQILGLLVAGICVLANAASSVLGRGVNRGHRLSPLTVTVVSMGIGSFILLFAGIVVQGLPALTVRSWLIIGFLALVNTAFAFTLWNHTLRTLSAMESSIINNTMLIQIAVLAWIFLGERLVMVQIGGLALAAIGILLVQLRGKTTEVKSQPAPPPDEMTVATLDLD